MINEKENKIHYTFQTEFPSPPKFIFFVLDIREFDIVLCCFLSSGEKALQKLIKKDGEHWNVDNIKNIVTAKNLCSCRDPITIAFDVSGFNLTD